MNHNDLKEVFADIQKEIDNKIKSLSSSDKKLMDNFLSGRDLKNTKDLDEMSKELENLKAK
tara:strand:+ start:390 stop:572 length:183 start_codon:yes stop_codon:yes gene_type:complete